MVTLSPGQHVIWWPESHTGWSADQGMPAVLKKCVGGRMQLQVRRWNGDPVLVWTTEDRLQPAPVKR